MPIVPVSKMFVAIIGSHELARAAVCANGNLRRFSGAEHGIVAINSNHHLIAGIGAKIDRSHLHLRAIRYIKCAMHGNCVVNTI